MVVRTYQGWLRNIEKFTIHLPVLLLAYSVCNYESPQFTAIKYCIILLSFFSFMFLVIESRSAFVCQRIRIFFFLLFFWGRELLCDV